MSKKMGFYSVISLVIGSQIGTGILTASTDLAKYGILSIGGLFITSIGAILLAIVFAELCRYIPMASGPHAYIRVAFGDIVAFFTGWTYWVISWVSSIAVIIISITSLTPLIGEHSVRFYFALELILLAILTLLNIMGPIIASAVETVLVIFKVLPLLAAPLAAFMHFNIDNLAFLALPNQSIFYGVQDSAFYTLWLFIGLECVTVKPPCVDQWRVDLRLCYKAYK